MNKNNSIRHFSFCIVLFFYGAILYAQKLNSKDLIGQWYVEGTLMGDLDDHWLLPHNQSNSICGQDFNEFLEEGKGKEVRFDLKCKPKKKAFSWQLNQNQLTLTRGAKTKEFEIERFKNKQLILSHRIKPKSAHKQYFVYSIKESP